MSALTTKYINYYDDLCNLIENNEIKRAELLITLHPSVLNEVSYPDKKHIIYFIIRKQNNKMFRFVLTKQPSNTAYNLPEVFDEIISCGTVKMMRFFVNHFKLNFQHRIYESFIKKILSSEKYIRFHQFLLFETNLSYCFTIPNTTYSITMKYNCESIDVNGRKKVFINKVEGSDYWFDLDVLFEGKPKMKGNFFFSKYENMFLVLKQTPSPIKNFKQAITEIVKFI